MIARMVDDREQDPAPIEANARLIAAAPDLLEAAKEALTHIATSMPTDGVICAHLRAAIAKAEGDS